MVKLTWKKTGGVHKDLKKILPKLGDIDLREIYAEHAGKRYSIRFLPNKHLNSLVDCLLTANGATVYTKQVHLDYEAIFFAKLSGEQVEKNQAAVSAVKTAMKGVAGLLANGAKPVYKIARKNAPVEIVHKFDYAFKEVAPLNLFPHVKVLDKGMYNFFVRHAMNGLAPGAVRRGHPTHKYVFGVSDETFVSLTIELWPIFFPIAMKRFNDEQAKKDPPAPPAKKGKKAASEPDTRTPDVVAEKYTGPAPRKRNADALKRLTTPTERNPCVDKPENAKWKTLLAWAEKVRDNWEAMGRFASVEYLLYAARHGFSKNVNRGLKAERRIKLIFADEYARYQARMKAMTEKKEETPKADDPGKEGKPKKKGKDKWGFKLGTRASNINLAITKEPKTIKQVLKDAGESTAGSHISSLVRLKWVKKLPDGRIRVRKGKTGAK